MRPRGATRMAAPLLGSPGLSATVVDAPLFVSAAVAALVGLIGFLSPCVLPLVPGYLSFMAGMGAPGRGPSQRRLIASALLFTLGFTAVLTVSASALLTGLGGALAAHRTGVERVLGTVTIVLGAVFLGAFGFAQRAWRIPLRPTAGLVGAPLLGAAFGLAWTPCLTPTLAAVLGLSATQQGAVRGLVLTLAYCLGLSVPFVLIAAGYGWAVRAVGLVRRHARTVHRIGGGLLIVLGVLLITGTWTTLMDDLRAWVGPTGLGAGL